MKNEECKKKKREEEAKKNQARMEMLTHDLKQRTSLQSSDHITENNHQKQIIVDTETRRLLIQRLENQQQRLANLYTLFLSSADIADHMTDGGFHVGTTNYGNGVFKGVPGHIGNLVTAYNIIEDLKNGHYMSATLETLIWASETVFTYKAFAINLVFYAGSSSSMLKEAGNSLNEDKTLYIQLYRNATRGNNPERAKMWLGREGEADEAMRKIQQILHERGD